MAQPTLADYNQSNWGDQTNTNEVTGTVTWSAGDFIVAVGGTGDNGITLNTPTATGLTFSAVAGTPTTTANTAKVYAWTATAGSSGSSALQSTHDGSNNARGLSVFVFSGSAGLGNTAISAALGATTTQSLTRSQANSHVVQVMVDWNAVNDTTVTWTPSGQTQRVASFVSGFDTNFVANWGDQGAAGTTSYGFSGFAGGKMSAITLEILGSAASASLLAPQPAVANLIVR